MAENSTEKALASDNGVVEADAPQPQEQHTPPSGSRRFALSASVMGGLAALLAACGKYTTKYEKDVKGAKDTGNVGGVQRQGTGGSPGEGTNSTDPNNPNPSPTASPTAGPVVPPGCVDTSGATPKTPADLLLASGGQPVYALYGNPSSALLALKFKSSGTDALAVGDRVHVLAKRTNGSVILGTRVVAARDLYSVPAAGYGLIFESLDLNGAQKIEVLVHKPAMMMTYRMELDYSEATAFKRTLNSLPVVDLSIPRRKTPAEVTLLSAFQFGQNAPSMAGTSDIGNSATLGAMNHGGSYTAATTSATWSLGSVVNPAGNEQVIVQTVFGETVTPQNNHFLEHQSVVVYARRTRSVANANVTAYVRYFMYIG